MTHQIKFLGPVVVERGISKAEAKAAGFILSEDLWWTRNNRHVVLVDDLDESAVEYFEGEKDEFRIREVGKKEEPEEVKLTKKQQADLDASGVGQGSPGGSAVSGSTVGTGGPTSTSGVSTTTATT